MTHPFDKVLYVVSGRATFTSAGKSTLMTAGHVVTVPAGVAHHVTNEPDSVLQILWCIATAWGADGTEADEVGAWEQVDQTKGWHAAAG
jgi:mannose-6-phosphate isomerase-like protein (cupin superfamily)